MRRSSWLNSASIASPRDSIISPERRGARLFHAIITEGKQGARNWMRAQQAPHSVVLSLREKILLMGLSIKTTASMQR
jgi:hypothetical protein